MLSRLAAATLFTVAAVGCSSHQHSAPIARAAPLTDMEAVRLGTVFLNPRADRNLWLHSMQREHNGYMLAYTTVFDPTGQPPKESHLIIVRDDGSVREVPLRDGQ
jgi:hypothetical protein